MIIRSVWRSKKTVREKKNSLCLGLITNWNWRLWSNVVWLQNRKNLIRIRYFDRMEEEKTGIRLMLEVVYEENSNFVEAYSTHITFLIVFYVFFSSVSLPFAVASDWSNVKSALIVLYHSAKSVALCVVISNFVFIAEHYNLLCAWCLCTWKRLKLYSLCWMFSLLCTLSWYVYLHGRIDCVCCVVAVWIWIVHNLWLAKHSFSVSRKCTQCLLRTQMLLICI